MSNRILLMLTLMMVLALISCTEKDDPVVSPEESQVEGLADVTVMIYGSGGGSLDKNMVNKFRRLYDADGTLYEYNVKDPVFNYEDDVFTYTPEFVAESQWTGTLASVYETTVFDKAVGWSRWIRLNRQEPSLWSKSGFDDELDDDDL